MLTVNPHRLCITLKGVKPAYPLNLDHLQLTYFTAPAEEMVTLHFFELCGLPKLWKWACSASTHELFKILIVSPFWGVGVRARWRRLQSRLAECQNIKMVTLSGSDTPLQG